MLIKTNIAKTVEEIDAKASYDASVAYYRFIQKTDSTGKAENNERGL